MKKQNNLIYKETYKEFLESLNKRVSFSCLMIFIVFSVLMARLFFLQVLNENRYKLLSDRNRIYTSFSVAPRGRIYDRNGEILADSKFSYQAVINLNGYKKNDPNWESIKNKLQLEGSLTFEEFALKNKNPNTPEILILKENLNWIDLVKTDDLSTYIPGVFSVPKITRLYPYSEILCHIIGYVTQPRIEDIQDDSALKILGATIGKFGIEQTLEESFKGIPGIKQSEVNAKRMVIRILNEEEPKRGNDVHLSIDSKLQSKVCEIMKDIRAGAAVVIDIQTGEVLSIVSKPTFDPNIFLGKIAKTEWDKISYNNDNPLINRAACGTYSPGSTFKMIVALAALKLGVINENTKFNCCGHYDLNGHKFHCWKWKTGGHGQMDIVKAIEQSCDVFFFNLAALVGTNNIIAAAKDFGFNCKTGIEITNEKKGFLPNLTTFWKEKKLGLAINISIGQGQILATPLQLAVMTARIASGEILYPTLLKTNGVSERKKIPYSQKHLDIIRKGMKKVVSGNLGTARKINNEILEIAGKTGSTQVCKITSEERKRRKLDERPYHLKDHALFVAFAPFDKPKFAVAVLIEHGESGAKVAAPIAKEILLAAQETQSLGTKLSSAQLLAPKSAATQLLRTQLLENQPSAVPQEILGKK